MKKTVNLSFQFLEHFSMEIEWGVEHKSKYGIYFV